MKTKNIILTSMFVFALLAGAFLGITSLVSAQSSTSTELGFSEHGRGGGENLEAVAEILGVSAEELEEALKNSRPEDCEEGERCRPDFEAAAEALGISADELESAFQTVREEAHAERLATAAEELGVTVEELETALENARPAECADLEPGERPEEGINCRPDFEAVASELGVTVEELQSAIGKGGHRGQGLENVAETLGVTAEELQQALQDAKPEDCEEGERCRPDFEAAAEVLGVDAEDLENALHEERGGRGPRGEGEGGGPGRGGPKP